MSFGGISSPRESRGNYELGEAKVTLQDTRFLGIGRVLQEIYSGLLPTSYTYDEVDPKGGQV